MSFKASILSSQSKADADVDIVLQAKKTAQHQQGNVVVSEDTDMLALLAALSPDKSEIFLLNPSSSKKPGVCTLQRVYHQCIKSNTLVLHTFSGCDTTSASYYRGKVAFCRLFEKSRELHQYLEKFRRKVQQ